MTWRKQSNIPSVATKIAKAEGEPVATQAHILVALELIVEKISASLRWIWLTMFTLTLLVAALGFQIQTRNAIIDKVRDSSSQAQIAATEARIAAKKASSDLTKAIKDSQTSSANPAIVEAFTSIFRIDCKLNGTPSSCDYVAHGFPTQPHK